METCPVCKTAAIISRLGRDFTFNVQCSRCGNFGATEEAVDTIQLLSSEKRSGLGAMIRERTVAGNAPFLFSAESAISPQERKPNVIGIDKLLEESPKTLQEKRRRFLLNLARLSPSEGGHIHLTDNDYFLAFTRDAQGLRFSLKAAKKDRLLEFNSSLPSDVILTYKGWQEIQIDKGSTPDSSREAFIGAQDPLLPVFARDVLDRGLQKMIDATVQAQQPIAVLMLDIDYFKTINDSYGHQAGDDVLRSVVMRVKKVIGARGYVFRYGGDEATVVLPNFDSEEAKAVADRFRIDIQNHQTKPEKRVTISVGVAASSSHISGKELLYQADMGLLEAKKMGRNCVKFSPK